MSLIFNANIELKISNIDNIKLENCKISFDNAKVTFSGNLSKEDRDKLKQAYTNNPSFDFSEILRNAEYDVFENRSNSVKMELPQYCYIEKYCIHFSIYEKENSISWNLPCARFSFKSTITHDFKILSIPFITFSSLWGATGVDFQLSYKNVNYTFSYDDSYIYTKVISDKNWQNFDELLALINLYTKCPISIIESYSSNTNGIQQVEWKSSQFDLAKENLKNYDLNKLIVEKGNNIREFIENSKWKENDDNELKRTIYTYVNSKYLPFHLQFLTSYSALEKYVKKQENQNIKVSLSTYNIEVNKIGESTQKKISSLNLKLTERDNKDVTSFRDLRNYIMHYTSSNEIDDFLDEGELACKMNMAIVIILLKLLGFDSIQYKNKTESILKT